MPRSATLASHTTSSLSVSRWRCTPCVGAPSGREPVRWSTDLGRSLPGILAGVLAVTGSAMIVAGAGPAHPPRAVIRVAAPVSDHPASGTPAISLARGLRRSVPVHLDIPSIGVHTALIDLGLNADGTVAVPPLDSNSPAGWYRYLPTPGEVGPAVILGHVDSSRWGPAVFFRLAELRPGDWVLVDRADGTTATFQVNVVAEYPKTEFPTALVYGPVDYPALRLITCGGSFDWTQHHYRDNVVVYAALADRASSQQR